MKVYTFILKMSVAWLYFLLTFFFRCSILDYEINEIIIELESLRDYKGLC